jgi:hypothetical protein
MDGKFLMAALFDFSSAQTWQLLAVDNLRSKINVCVENNAGNRGSSPQHWRND